MKLLFPVIHLNKEEITNFGIYNRLEFSFDTTFRLNHCNTHAILTLSLFGFGFEYKWRFDDNTKRSIDNSDNIS